MRDLTLEDYVDMAKDTVEWRIHGLVPKPGKIILMGPPKAGKSTLAIAVANHAATGEEFFGHKVEPGRVLYLQLDTGEAVWRDTLRRLREAGMRFSTNVRVIHPEDQKRPLNILHPDTRTYLRDALTTVKPDLVIIDTLRKLHNGDENDSTAMKAVMDHIEDIFGELSLILVHHTRKIPADVTDPDPATFGRGSNFLTGDVDGLWLLYRSTLKVESRFDEILRYKLIRDESGLWSCPEQADQKTLVAALLAYCAEHPATPHNVLHKMAKTRFGVSRSTFYRLLAGRACAHRPAR